VVKYLNGKMVNLILVKHNKIIKKRITNLRKLTDIQRLFKQATDKRSVWTCSCGRQIPKKEAELSGYASGNQGFHVHCPGCGKIVAQFLTPKQLGQVNNDSE
jgi:hypothetical protein